MPQSIAFVNGKGGVGKTTVATLVAAAFRQTSTPVSIDDRDPQLSATTAAGIFDIPLGTSGEIVMIDTAPAIYMPSTLDAVQTADLVVLVTSPSPLDLATTAATAKWIQAQRQTGQTRLLFNMVQTTNRFFENMDEIAKDIPFPVLKKYLTRLTGYQVAQIGGWRSMPKQCREEIIQLTLEIVAVVDGVAAKSRAQKATV